MVMIYKRGKIKTVELMTRLAIMAIWWMAKKLRKDHNTVTKLIVAKKVKKGTYTMFLVLGIRSCIERLAF